MKDDDYFFFVCQLIDKFPNFELIEDKSLWFKKFDELINFVNNQICKSERT